MVEYIEVPPDGGWGWVVCFSNALSNIVTIPIMQSFGLIFKDKFQMIGFSATDSSVIININSSFGMLMGLVNGLLLKSYGYRKMAILGGVLLSIGVILTAFAENFISFIIFYGLLTSLGFGLSFAAFSLAINTYFRKNRGRAIGFAMTGTGLGPILMPLFISYLLSEYGTTGTTLIIGAISIHSVLAGILLQPLKWHVKLEIPPQELVELNKKTTDNHLEKPLENDQVPEETYEHNVTGSMLSIDHDVETKSIYGFETPLPRRKTSISSLYETGKHRKRIYSRSTSQPEKEILSISLSSLKSSKAKDEMMVSIKEIYEKNSVDEELKQKSYFARIVEIFDLDLLKDPGYLTIMIGMSLAVCAEINFSLLTPFILNDFHFTTFEIAVIMSTLAFVDLLFRFCAPFIAEKLRFSAKLMYTCSLILLIASRSAMIFVTDFYQMIGVAVFLGIAKGFRTVFMSLLIPSYVSIEKLPSASGIQMVVNGLLILIGGPFLGVIRDISGSYKNCIIILNTLSFVTILIWAVEYLLPKRSTKR